MSRHLLPQRRSFIPILVVLAACVLATSCSPAVGDACASSSDCPSDVPSVCDNTIVDGYCLVPNCRQGSCPADSVCVVFDPDTRFCMASCEADSECRQAQSCRRDHNLSGEGIGYCYLPAGPPQ